MTPGEPLISVVIPTRERAAKLRYTLQTVLSQPGDDFEVVVSDNASEDATAETVSSFRDSRLRYFRTPSRLSMCDNWEFAFERTTGKYLIYIGDDDALAPDSLNDLAAAVRDFAARLYCWEAHIYQWPGDGSPASLRHFASRCATVRVNLGDLTRFSFRWGGLRYMRLPLLYHSLVERGVLEEIRRVTGRIFHSTQPDVFLAFAMPAVCAEAVRIGKPLSVYGASERAVDSGAIARREGAFAEKTHRFAAEYANYRFHPTLPPELPFWVKMIPDAMLVARDLFPDFYRDRPFDYDAMWAFLWRYWHFEGVRAILGRRREIRQRHPFHPARFCAFVAAHALSEARIAARRWRGAGPGRYRRSLPPENIAEFVRDLPAYDHGGAA